MNLKVSIGEKIEGVFGNKKSNEVEKTLQVLNLETTIDKLVSVLDEINVSSATDTANEQKLEVVDEKAVSEENTSAVVETVQEVVITDEVH